jgi:hypothetical protein
MLNFESQKKFSVGLKIAGFLFLLLGILLAIKFLPRVFKNSQKHISQVESESIFSQTKIAELSEDEKKFYDQKMLELANLPVEVSNASSTTPSPQPSPTGRGGGLWPVKTVYPNRGALLPFNRIVAFYGNLYSKGMGVLGEYPENIILEKLSSEVKKWQEADPETPVVPALHYIAVVAQAGAGKDGKYRARMPDREIEKVLEMAEKISGIVFLDIQVGLSNLEKEIPHFEKYLKLPNVHLGIDPEFAMHNGTLPGKQIGSLDAKDVNYAINYLSELVKTNNLSPKVLVVHRFTRPMLTNAKNIQPTSEVQVVVQMDGFGAQANKLNTYKQYIYKEPVQFAGFKIFYKNDRANGQKILESKDLLKLSPKPSYIQFQ